jgi:hypothetical protein
VQADTGFVIINGSAKCQSGTALVGTPPTCVSCPVECTSCISKNICSKCVFGLDLINGQCLSPNPFYTFSYVLNELVFCGIRGCKRCDI